jgi:hypothetical protein
MPSQLVEIARFNDYGEIHIICGFLQSHGIHCAVFDDSASSTLWAFQQAMRGSRLMVHENDVEQAKALLLEMGTIAPPTESMPENTPTQAPTHYKPAPSFFSKLMSLFTGKKS